MKSGSLRTRLLLLATGTTLVLLCIAGFVVHALFQKHVEAYAQDRLTVYFDEILGQIEADTSGMVTVSGPMSDPRFQQVESGLYWQINAPNVPPLRSRSLWEAELDLARANGTGGDDTILKGPNGSDLIALIRSISIETAQGSLPLVIAVAQDRAAVANTVSSFASAVVWSMATLGVALVAASASMIALGLKPMQQLKAQVESLRTGKLQRVAGTVPTEVQPLADEINALLEAREKQLERARQRAGNLAHGLKTPLAVMAAIAHELGQNGQSRAADEILHSTTQMRDLVERELARSRMATRNAPHRALLHESISRIVATMSRVPGSEHLNFKTSVPASIEVGLDRLDLIELLGNLIDNARKHARQTVSIVYAADQLTVEDDGQGVPADKLIAIKRRGIKLDEGGAGSGLGLAIVSDIAEAYGLKIDFTAGDLGGLKVAIGLPALLA